MARPTSQLYSEILGFRPQQPWINPARLGDPSVLPVARRDGFVHSFFLQMDRWAADDQSHFA
jgi:hypothetical protein